MKKYLVLATLFLFIGSLSAQININDRTDENNKSDLSLLVSYMQGSFSSEEQSKSDTNFFDIRLQMKPMWQERSDAIWIYVEQAVSSKLEKPYRQRVYKVITIT